jgi:hypothetical protein
MKNITIEQDIARHSRLSAAFAHIVHTDGADEDAYYAREAKHFDFCTAGSSKNNGKVYYARSPYSSIEVCGGGFIMHNHVTGKQWPFATFEAAVAVRSGTSARYSSIEFGRNDG